MSLLLTSVFRPFGVDDAYGRKENKLELFHNQVTREQGIFSLRYNHRSFGLHMIAENLKMPTVILDFPTIKQFREELKKGYDYVGISFITPNFLKAREMARVARETAPSTRIILGGHGTRIPDIEKLIDCDYVLPGEGISKLRELFGEDVNAPIKHPVVRSADNMRILGLPFGRSAAVLIPGVGCPNACRFCATSHFFDKTYTPFLKTGREIFDTCARLSDALNTNDMFVMDENFLKQKERALELVEIMERENRQFNFSIFSSAEAVTSFGIENMLRLGITYLWIGAESRQALFEKNRGIDLKQLIADMRGNGIFVLASSILFLEHHDKENIGDDIDYAISLAPDFTQFMQLGPMPQTQLYLDYKAQGKLREDIPYEEWHGQHRLWFNHPNFTPEESETLLRDAFRREFEVLGPSILRVGETMIRGLRSPYYDTDDPFMLRRRETILRRCKAYYYALPALKRLAPTQSMKQYADHILEMFRETLGPRPLLTYASTAALYPLASLARFKMEHGSDAHNPRAMKTLFRIPPAAYQTMKGGPRIVLRNRAVLAVIDNPGGAGVLSLHFSGKIKPKTVDSLIERIKSRQQFSPRSVRISITPLARFKEEIFERFLEKLSNMCRDIRVYCPETRQPWLAFFKKLTSRRLCSVSTY